MYELFLAWFGANGFGYLYEMVGESVLAMLILSLFVVCGCMLCTVIIYLFDLLCGSIKQLWKRG